jgi:two-component system response regulator DegU
MKPIRVVLAEDHPVVREGIRALLERAPDLVVVAEASDGQEALRLIDEMTPDVLLLDMEMPGVTGVEVARRLHANGSPVRILALSSHNDDQYILGLLEAGAAGYLLKEEAPEAIVAAVRGAAQGEAGWLSQSVAQKVMRHLHGAAEETCPLTEREMDVLQLLAKGWTNARIAKELTISERTVGFHVGNLLQKMQADSRTEVVVTAINKGWLKA